MFCGRKLQISAEEILALGREIDDNIEAAQAHIERLMRGAKHFTSTSRAILAELAARLAEATVSTPPELVRT